MDLGTMSLQMKEIQCKTQRESSVRQENHTIEGGRVSNQNMSDGGRDEHRLVGERTEKVLEEDLSVKL